MIFERPPFVSCISVLLLFFVSACEFSKGPEETFRPVCELRAQCGEIDESSIDDCVLAQVDAINAAEAGTCYLGCTSFKDALYAWGDCINEFGQCENDDSGGSRVSVSECGTINPNCFQCDAFTPLNNGRCGDLPTCEAIDASEH